MKPAQLGSISSYLSSLDDDLSARVDDLFGRYPALHGFSVQGANALPEAVRNNVMANTLVVAEVALMEPTVHLLDMADTVGGVQPSEKALTATRDLLIAVPDPTAAIEVLTGRAARAAAVPAIR